MVILLSVEEEDALDNGTIHRNKSRGTYDMY